MKRSIAAVLVTGLALGGCAGGGSNPLLPAQSQSRPAHKDQAGARLPRARRITLTIRAASLHNATARLTVHPDSAPAFTFVRTLAPPLTALAFDVPAGGFTFDLETFAGARRLSSDRGVRAVGEREASATIPITLDTATPKAIYVVPSPTGQDVTGDQTGGFNIVGAYKANGTTKFVRYFTALAVDSNGNVILGTGAPKMTMTSLTPGVLSNGVVTTVNPNRFGVTPIGSGGFPQTGLMKVTATPLTGNALTANVTMRVPYLTAPRVYALFPNLNKVLIYDELGYAIPIPNAFSTIDDASSFTFDKHNNSIYLINGVPAQIIRYTINGAILQTLDVLAGSEVAHYDPATGYIYAAQFNAPVAMYNENLSAVSTVTGTWKETPNNAYPIFATGFLGDTRNGQFYLLDNSTNVVQAYDSSGNALYDWAPLKRGSDLYGLAQDPSTGYLYVTDAGPGVQVFDEAGQPVVLPASFAGLTQAGPLCFDETNARIYTVDVASGTMHAFTADGYRFGSPGGFPGIGGAQALMSVP